MLNGKNGETRSPSQPKIKNQIKTKTTRQNGATRLYSEKLEWLQDFKENLVDDRVPERRDSHASSSLHILRADHPHVHRHLLFKQQILLLWPLDAKVLFIHTPFCPKHGGHRGQLRFKQRWVLSHVTQGTTPPIRLLLSTAADGVPLLLAS